LTIFYIQTHNEIDAKLYDKRFDGRLQSRRPEDAGAAV